MCQKYYQSNYCNRFYIKFKKVAKMMYKMYLWYLMDKNVVAIYIEGNLLGNKFYNKITSCFIMSIIK